MNTIKLGNVSKLITKGTTPTTLGSDFVSEGVNFVKSESITESKYLDSTIFEHITPETNEKMKRSQLKENDLLFSIAGAYLGKVGIVRNVDLPLNTNQAVGIVRLDTEKVNIDYAYYYFTQKSMNSYMNKLSAQSAQPNLNLEMLGNLPIYLPDLPTQKKIADVLSCIDDKIALNNKTNSELENMAKTVYDYWFTQFDFPDANGNPYKTSGGKMEYNQVLKREIPVGWEVKKVGDLIAKNNNKFEIPTSEFKTTGFYPIIDQSSDFIAGYTDDSTGLIDSNKGVIIFGDHTRFLKFINFNFIRGGDGTQLINSNNKRMPNIIFYFELLNFDLSNYGYARHYKFLKDKDIILPDEDTSSKYEKYATELFNQIKKNIQENEELTKLRDYLLPLLMNSQIEVK